MTAETIHVRAATAQDIGALTLVLERANAYRDNEPLPVLPTEARINNMLERMGRTGAWTYVACDERDIVGFALGYPRLDEAIPNQPADTEYLSLLMVEPTYWGRGVASRLLDTATEAARNDGRKRLTLRTRDQDNYHARAVYEHRGFRLTGVTKSSEFGKQVEYELPL